MKVKIYSTPVCPYCDTLKTFLKENNVEFESFDVSSDDNAREEMMNISGAMTVPVIAIDKQVIVGFNLEEIKKALNIQ